jgi:hypothetical protein
LSASTAGRLTDHCMHELSIPHEAEIA